MLVAAEASGDSLGARLARTLRARLPGVRLVGVGGARMAGEGIDSPFDTSELSVFGLLEGVAIYPKVLKRVKETAALAAREKPDVAVLIDSWGFNLRVAHALRKLNPEIKLIKYVGPQIWASRPGRAKTLARAVDHLLAILPFDEPLYRPYGLPVTFVGNPSLTLDVSKANGGRFRKSIGAKADAPLLLVLPGSRRGEITRVLPAFAEAAAILKAQRPDLHIAVVAAETVAEQVKTAVAAWPIEVTVVEGHEAKLDAMKAATVTMACSGTVTTELALAGAPMVVGYKVSPVTYAIGKRLIRTKWIVLLNIAVADTIVPELLQHECEGPRLAAEIATLLDDPALRDVQVADQNAALKVMGLGAPDPAIIAAEVVAGYLKT